MYCTTHALVGGLAGGVVPTGLGSFVTGVATHAVCDMIPHHDYHEVYWGVLDAGLAITLITLLARVHPAPTLYVAGAVGGAIPDLEIMLSHILPKGFRGMFPTHSGLLTHGRWSWPGGFLFQVVVGAIAAGLVMVYA